MKRITMFVYIHDDESADGARRAMAAAAAQNAVCESIASKVEDWDFESGKVLNTEKDRRFNESFGLNA